MVALNFDATNVAPENGVDAIPGGWYIAAIDKDEMKPTKAGDGSYLEQRFKVLDGQYTGRYVYVRLNLRNPNADAERIARGQLSAEAHAAGILQLQDSAQLYGVPMKIKVKQKAATGEYEASNEITAWKNINDPSAVNAPGTGNAPVFGNAGPGQGGFANPGHAAAAAAFGNQQNFNPAYTQPQGQAQGGFQPQQPQAGFAAGGPTQAPQQQFNPQQQQPQQQTFVPPQQQQPWEQPQQQNFNPAAGTPMPAFQGGNPDPNQGQFQPQQQPQNFQPQQQTFQPQQQQFDPSQQQQHQQPNPGIVQARAAVPPWERQS